MQKNEKFGNIKRNYLRVSAGNDTEYAIQARKIFAENILYILQHFCICTYNACTHQYMTCAEAVHKIFSSKRLNDILLKYI